MPPDIGTKTVFTKLVNTKVQESGGSSNSEVKAVRLEKPVRITEQVWPEGTVPVVSVRCITYQHVNFIREAIEGFLMQETMFPVEILIHDDASTDGTADIVREYQARYPQLIRTVLQRENQYSKGREVWRRAHDSFVKMLRGEFIALCEGDDYWISSHKLQRQVEAMLRAPECSACIHNAWEVEEKTSYKRLLNTECRKPRFTIREMFRHEFIIPTASMLFRHSLHKKATEVRASWLQQSVVGDRPLQMLLLDTGPFVYIDDVMSVYRRHAGGMMQQLNNNYVDKVIPNFIEMYRSFDQSTSGRHQPLVFTEMRRLAREQVAFRLSDLDVLRNDFVFRGDQPPPHMGSPDACIAAVETVVNATAASLEGEELREFEARGYRRGCQVRALVSAGDGWMQAGDKVMARVFYRAAAGSGSSIAIWFSLLTCLGALGNTLWSLTRRARTGLLSAVHAWRSPMRRKQSLAIQ